MLRMANWISHILCRNCLLKHITEGKTEWMGRQGRRGKQQLNDLQEMRKLEKESLDHTMENSLWKRL